VKNVILAGLGAGLIAVGLFAAPVGSQPRAPQLLVQDDGVRKGLAHTLNCTGAAVCAVDGGVAALSVVGDGQGVVDVVADLPLESDCAPSGTCTVSMPPADAATSGYLAATDWQVFAAKLSSVDGTDCSPDYYARGIDAVGNATGCSYDRGFFIARALDPLYISDNDIEMFEVASWPATATQAGHVTTSSQTFAGAKIFRDGVVTATVDAPDESSLRLRALTGGVIIESGTDKSAAAYPITLLPENNVLYSPSATARTLTLDLATQTPGRAVFEITNSGDIENSYGADLSIPKGDLLIGPTASPTATIDVNGEATVYSITANVWGSHGHTDASSGGTLSASAIASGTLAVARGGTGVSTATSDAVLVGNGSAWQAKVIPDCDTAGSRLRYDATTNTFSCATTEGWTTISAFSNGWDSCTITPRYRKDLDGRVHLSGCIKSGTRGVTATTLPTGYRPSRTSMFSAVAIGETSFAVSPCAIVMTSTGALVVSSVGCDSTYGIYLDGISFWTD
jgi:hypothetical protein